MIKIYEIPSDKLSGVKNILEAPEKVAGELDVEIEKEAGRKGTKVEKAKEWKINEFKRAGYILRDGKALGFEEKESYLYIDADEDFFKRNEKILLDAGAKVLEGEKFEQVKKKIEKAEREASAGVGFIFGG
ncbi:MAG: hypothetical protein IB618_03590 [Candidatus Pacearchaeota archaeon]|nr:MAG: hypothetical protein IB618_03590 [Candidatus Pacearchaeota archaeon]